MRQLHFLLLISITLFLACNCQIQPVEGKENGSSNYQYKDFTYDGDRIWGLTTDGQLTIIEGTNGKRIAEKVKNDSVIIVLAKDKEANIVIGDKSNSIKKYEKKTHSWTTLFKFDNDLLGITFDSKNNCYLITNKGIFDHSSNKYFYPDSSENDQIRPEAGWLSEPTFLTDRNDNIWIGFGYGEWGGNLFIFNTTAKQFIVPKLEGFPITLNPIKSIFESAENVFVTSGLMHFYTSGCIAKFENFQSKIVFKSEWHRKFPDDSTNSEIINGEYIGPGTYNVKDHNIYFYSQNGILKGNPKNDLSKIENWTNVLQPKLHWSNGQRDAVGSPMNVLKLKFIDPDKFVFVSQNDGIGIYDGKKLIMTR